MQAIIFTGIQGSGKTSFYKEHFLKTHVRISLDLLKTRNKEKQFMQLCLQTEQKFVVDNTNPTVADRARYIEAAKAYRFKVTGYLFHSDVQKAIERNNTRTGKEVVSIIGIRATYKKIQPPTIQEGYDELFIVTLSHHGFHIERTG